NKANGSLAFDIHDPEQWRTALTRVISLLYRMLIRRGIHAALAEELTQRSVFDAVRKRHQFDPKRGSLEQWMVAIARNHLALETRQRALRQTKEREMLESLRRMDTDLLPDELLERKETRHLVRVAMEKLEDKERQVLVLKYHEDLSARQIAKEMDLTEKAVHNLLYRARNHLRDKLINSEPLFGKGPE
ncbi:MAG: sigma-70 family RNA polymerase sigma factor, partial [Sedimentisphaerales bacterium]|nr:sigma-70 family RNA polymerase sigma factor [Sedimentisphaerales bacterium]